jgi:hypothetical protein
MIYRILFVSVLLVTLSLSIATPVSAHGRTPRLEISAERINPGGVLDIRGVEFDYEESISLYLERPGIVVQLGQLTADLEGIFIHTIVLPSDLPPGAYSIRGVTEHHDVISPAFTVQGSAVSNEESRRDERDALLAPVPTYAPGVVPGGVAAVPTQPVAAPATIRDSMGFMGLILLVLGILAALGLRVTGKK